MPAVPGCTAPRPLGPLDSPDHSYTLYPREVSPELTSGELKGLPSSMPSGQDWGLMTQAELQALVARGLNRKQEGAHVPVSGEEHPGQSTTPLDSAGAVGVEAWAEPERGPGLWTRPTPQRWGRGCAP